MLDFELQERLKTNVKKFQKVYIIWVIIAVIMMLLGWTLRITGVVKGAEEPSSPISVMGILFILYLILIIPAIIFLRRLIPPGKGDTSDEIMNNFFFFQLFAIIVPLNAVVWGLFMIGESLGYLLVGGLACIATIIIIFPRYAKLEEAVMEMVMRDETIQPPDNEPEKETE